MAQIPKLATGVPGRRDTHCLVFNIARGEAISTVRATMPKGAMPLYVTINGSTGSNAGTTATLSLGTAANNTYFLNGVSVLGAAGVGQITPTSLTNCGKALTADTVITAGYAESGTVSSTGGPWTIVIEYTRLGPGEYNTSTGLVVQ